VAGDDGDRRRDTPVRHRDPGIGRDGDGGTHPRNDLERDAGGGEGHRLLSSAAEHERIAALEPDDPTPTARVGNEERVDVLLRERVNRPRLAHEDAPGVGGRQLDHAGMDETIVDDNVGAA
jgi:hypothetical protein